MRRCRRKSCRAQPPGFPDAISLHFLWGRMRWWRNCVNLVPVKILKGFVPSVTSYGYSSLALDNIPSILMPEDCVGKGVSEVVCVFDIIFVITYCAFQHQGLFRLALQIKDIKATVPINLRKYYLVSCTEVVCLHLDWQCHPQLDGCQSWVGICLPRVEEADSNAPLLFFWEKD